ncbi:hypothetical protein GCM10010483_53830 [Actinokineospora diospyrosa]
MPWITTVGSWSPRSFSVRSPEASTATDCRSIPVRSNPRSNTRPARSAAPASSKANPGEDTARNAATCHRTNSARVPGGAPTAPNARRSACPTAGSPVVDMIEVNDSTLCGNSTATVCAIIPPIDAPTRCTRSNPSRSTKPTVSAAISDNV